MADDATEAASVVSVPPDHSQRRKPPNSPLHVRGRALPAAGVHGDHRGDHSGAADAATGTDPVSPQWAADAGCRSVHHCVVVNNPKTLSANPKLIFSVCFFGLINHLNLK